MLFGACFPKNRYLAVYPIGSSFQSTHEDLLNRLRGLGWRIFTRQTHVGHIVAANNETENSRDVVMIDLQPNGDISLWIRTEMANHGFITTGRWIVPHSVCDGYTWSREQNLLGRLIGNNFTSE